MLTKVSKNTFSVSKISLFARESKKMSNLQQMTITELKALCKEHNITGYSASLRDGGKAGLIEFVEQALDVVPGEMPSPAGGGDVPVSEAGGGDGDLSAEEIEALVHSGKISAFNLLNPKLMSEAGGVDLLVVSEAGDVEVPVVSEAGGADDGVPVSEAGGAEGPVIADLKEIGFSEDTSLDLDLALPSSWILMRSTTVGVIGIEQYRFNTEEGDEEDVLTVAFVGNRNFSHRGDKGKFGETVSVLSKISDEPTATELWKTYLEICSDSPKSYDRVHFACGCKASIYFEMEGCVGTPFLSRGIFCEKHTGQTSFLQMPISLSAKEASFRIWESAEEPMPAFGVPDNKAGQCLKIGDKVKICCNDPLINGQEGLLLAVGPDVARVQLAAGEYISSLSSLIPVEEPTVNEADFATKLDELGFIHSIYSADLERKSNTFIETYKDWDIFFSIPNGGICACLIIKDEYCFDFPVGDSDEEWEFYFDYLDDKGVLNHAKRAIDSIAMTRNSSLVGYSHES